MLNRVSFFKKIIILFIVSVAIPLFMQNYIYYTQTENNIQKDMLDKLNNSLDDKAAKISGALAGAVTLLRTYTHNEALYRTLDTSYKDNLSYLMAYNDELKILFEKDLPYYRQIKNIIIYTNNDTVFNGAYVQKLENLNINTLDENLMEMKNKISSVDNPALRVAWEPQRGALGEERSISLLVGMNYFRQYGKFEKLLRVNINTTYFEDILSESNLFDNMILTDSKGRVISSVHSYSQDGEYDYFSPSETEKGIEVLTNELDNYPVVLYGLYDTKIISNEFKNSRIQTVLITLGGIMFAVLSVFIVMGNISRRLNLVVKQSQEIANGNFIQMEYDNKGADEISILEKGMNKMSGRLKDLIENDYRMQIDSARLEQETTQAKLLALQSQINPHVLFNSLESIRLKAMAKGEAETARMIKYISKMFRNVINWDESVIRLADEIRFLDEFLNLQNYRFEDEFEYNIDVEEEAYDCMIPKMIVQTLVENACIHGVGAIVNNKFVSVIARVKGEQLALTVEDNGGGMTSERLEVLKLMLRGEGKVSKSVGIYNVYKRLQLYYGEEFLFDIDSKIGEGTKCIIQIPAKYQ